MFSGHEIIAGKAVEVAMRVDRARDLHQDGGPAVERDGENDLSSRNHLSKLRGSAVSHVAVVVIFAGCSGPAGRAGSASSGGGPVDQGSGGASVGSGGASVGGGGDAGSDGTEAGVYWGDDAGIITALDDGSTTAPSGGEDAASACVDDAMSVGCDLGDAGCSSVLSYCQRLSNALKPAILAQAVSCINLVAGCDERKVVRCVKVALFSACPDPSADAPCAEVSRLCTNSIPTTADECHAFLNGMTPAGRQAILSCLSSPDGGPPCPEGVYKCLQGL
jgi:hypothetical protein